MATYISIGAEKHLPILNKAALSGSPTRWTVNSHATKGDTILFYIRAPVSAIVAVGTLVSPRAVRGGVPDWPHLYSGKIRVNTVGQVPVALRTIKQILPDWGWPRSPQTHALIPEAHERQLLELIESDSSDVVEDEVSPESGARVGGGFGTADQNRETEAAAVRTVKETLKAEGWVLKRDCQMDRCGYDFEYSKNRKTLHVEVKGIGGTEPAFIITAKELRCAREDPDFMVFIVTSALTRKPKIKRYSGAELVESYVFKEIAYLAKPKPNRS